MTATGRLLHVSHSGATGTSSILSEFSSAANDETVILKVTASDVLASGTALAVSVAAMTTGTALDISGMAAITTGKGINVAASGTTRTDGILVNITDASTAATSTGRMLYVGHTGVTGVSTILSEFASAAGDETVIMKVTASGALAAGKGLFISGASVTTGTLLDISDNTAATTGKAVNIVTNSADTGTRSTVYISQSNASASGATALEVNNAGALATLKLTALLASTHFRKLIALQGVTLWSSDGTTAQGNLSGTAGDICFNGGSNKPEYCTGTTNWTALV